MSRHPFIQKFSLSFQSERGKFLVGDGKTPCGKPRRVSMFSFVSIRKRNSATGIHKSFKFPSPCNVHSWIVKVARADGCLMCKNVRYRVMSSQDFKKDVFFFAYSIWDGFLFALRVSDCENNSPEMAQSKSHWIYSLESVENSAGRTFTKTFGWEKTSKISW